MDIDTLICYLEILVYLNNGINFLEIRHKRAGYPGPFKVTQIIKLTYIKNIFANIA